MTTKKKFKKKARTVQTFHHGQQLHRAGTILPDAGRQRGELGAALRPHRQQRIPGRRRAQIAEQPLFEAGRQVVARRPEFIIGLLIRTRVVRRAEAQSARHQRDLVQRLLHARDMLTAGENYLSAAFACGYESSSGFRAAFAKQFGRPPGRLKEKNQ